MPRDLPSTIREYQALKKKIEGLIKSQNYTGAENCWRHNRVFIMKVLDRLITKHDQLCKLLSQK